MKIKSSGGKNISCNLETTTNSKWKNTTTIIKSSSSSINSKHKQKAYISPYSRTLPTYNTNAAIASPPPAVTAATATAVPPYWPPLPPLPPTSDNDVPPMPPPPPSTTPPPPPPSQLQLHTQQHLYDMSSHHKPHRKDQGKLCNSISKTTMKSVYSSPAIHNNYVNNISRSQQQPQQQQAHHFQYNHINSSPMTSGSTNSLSENNLLLKTVGSYRGVGGGFINNGFPSGGTGASGNNFYERDNKCHERKRRRATTNRNESGVKWVLEEAVKALAVENQYSMPNSSKTLVINFPDPEISKSSIQEFSDAIVNVRVLSPLTPRFCIVALKDGANVQEVIEKINKIPFGCGYLSARLRSTNEQETSSKPECIEPRTLYIGNLSPTINPKSLKAKYEKCVRMDMGYAQKMKFTRWAFVRFANVDDAIEAYKMTVNSMMDDRNLIVRFRRVKNTNINSREENTPKMNEENVCNINNFKTTTNMTTSLVEQDKNHRIQIENVIKDVKEMNNKNDTLLESKIIDNDEDDSEEYDDDDDDVLPSNILTALPSSVVLEEPSKSAAVTCSSLIAPPSPLMQEEDAVFEPPIRADIIMDTPSPSLPSNTPTQDEGTPNHLTEQLLLPSPLLQDANEDDDDDDDDIMDEVEKGKHLRNSCSSSNNNPANNEENSSSCNVVYNMPLLDTPQSSLSIHDESLSFDTTPLLLSGSQDVDVEDPSPSPPPPSLPPPPAKESTPFKDNSNNKKTPMKSTMQDSCDITSCFFNLDSTRVPALLEAETSDEVMARLSNEATPLPSPLLFEDDDNDYQVYEKTPPKSRSNNRSSTISCSLGHSQSKNDNLSAQLSASGSKSSLSSAEKDYQITPPKEKSPAIKSTSSVKKNFQLENGFNCFDWSFSADEFTPDYSDDNIDTDKEIKNFGLLGAADENQSDDRDEDLSNCEYADFDEDVYALLDDDTELPASKRRKTNKEKTADEKDGADSRVLTEVEIKRETIDDTNKHQTDEVTPQEQINCDFVAFAEEHTCDALSNEETTLPNCNFNKMTPVNDIDECNSDEPNQRRRRCLTPPEALSELEIKTEDDLRENGQPHTGGGSSFGSDVSNASTVDDWNHSGKKPLEWTDCELEYDLFSQLNSNNESFLSTV